MVEYNLNKCTCPRRCRTQANCISCCFYKTIDGILHSHIWDNETPNRIYTHSHVRGDAPHGHHGSRYWKVEKEG